MRKSRYKWFYDKIHSRYYNLLMKYCFLPFGGEWQCRLRLISDVDYQPGERILDMCCGTGGSTLAVARLAGRDSQIIGMDISSGQLRMAAKRRSAQALEFVEGDVCDTGLPTEQFDKVFITFALHEMWRQERLTALCEAHRVLRAEGEIIVTELDRPDSLLLRAFIGLWYGYWLPFNFETPTRHDMLREGLAAELSEVGFFDVKRRRHYRGVFQVVAGRK